jgi:hypothetical protein
VLQKCFSGKKLSACHSTDCNFHVKRAYALAIQKKNLDFFSQKIKYHQNWHFFFKKDIGYQTLETPKNRILYPKKSLAPKSAMKYCTRQLGVGKII